MPELLYFEIDPDCAIAVEVDAESTGFQRAGTGAGTALPVTSFGSALAHARRAAEVALRQFTSMVDGPDEIELEFGIRFSAESGAIIAKATTEGNINVKLIWRAPAS
ncbi:hypothetical protein K1W54_38870 [Micromonospora sp. CPCC 205371]|nr:hypothetical protein [Micromonospora sp. CPCC 205371]